MAPLSPGGGSPPCPSEEPRHDPPRESRESGPGERAEEPRGKVVTLEDLVDASSLVFHALAACLPVGATIARPSRVAVRLACAVLRGTTERTILHLSAYFGHLTEPQLVDLAHANLEFRWRHREIGWMHQLSASTARRRALCQHVQIEGLAWLEEALRKGRGAILWEGRLGNRLLGKVALAERGYRLCQVHDRRHGGTLTWFGQHVIRRLYRRMEARLFPDVVLIEPTLLGYLRAIRDRLARNGIVCLSAMGTFGFKFVQQELLGRQRRFATGAVSLARMTGAALLPIVSVRLPDGTEQVVIEEPVDVHHSEPSDDAIARAVLQYVRLLETHVQAHPEQWLGWD